MSIPSAPPPCVDNGQLTVEWRHTQVTVYDYSEPSLLTGQVQHVSTHTPVWVGLDHDWVNLTECSVQPKVA